MSWPLVLPGFGAFLPSVSTVQAYLPRSVALFLPASMQCLRCLRCLILKIPLEPTERNNTNPFLRQKPTKVTHCLESMRNTGIHN